MAAYDAREDLKVHKAESDGHFKSLDEFKAAVNSALWGRDGHSLESRVGWLEKQVVQLLEALVAVNKTQKEIEDSITRREAQRAADEIKRNRQTWVLVVGAFLGPVFTLVVGGLILASMKLKGP